MTRSRLCLLMSAAMLIILSTSSCTYDYFDDDLNYQVYVPEVPEESVSDCRVMVYSAADGTLVGERYTTVPAKADPRMAAGLFSFRLPPGEYRVYCYTNTDSVTFGDTGSLSTAAFTLGRITADGTQYFKEPSRILADRFTPSLVHKGIMVTDTASVEDYTGRITVRFREFPGDVDAIGRVRLEASGVATRQELATDTLTSRLGEGDVMLHDFDGVPEEKSDAGVLMEFDNLYFPSVENLLTSLNFIFYDKSGNPVHERIIEVMDKDGNPCRLYHGKRIIIDVFNHGIRVSLVGWNDNIMSDGGNTNM